MNYPKRLKLFLLSALLLAIPRPLLAVDGISVTTHWSIVDWFPFGGFGEIWRHDIQDSKVVQRTKLIDGPARAPTLSPDAKQVAVIRDDGMIVVVSMNGEVSAPLAQTHPQGFLDWPLGNWIYYSLGGFDQPSSSRYLRRVNAVTKVDEAVVTFERGTWRFGISADLSRAAVRVNDVQVEPWGRIVAYDMIAGNGKLEVNRSTDRFSCGTGMDPEGVYFIDGWNAHDGIDIRRWDTLEVVGSFSHADAAKWGGGAAGVGHNRNNWAANSQKWINIYLGWGLWMLPSGGNQVLYNWIDHERIVVTDNRADSWTFDGSGDFWVAGETTAAHALSPIIQHHPQDQIVVAGKKATFTVSATSGSVASYQWLRDGKVLEGATAWDLTLDTTSADNDTWYSCQVSNANGTKTSNAARLRVLPSGTVVTNFPPTAIAGFDTWTAPNRTVLLVGTVTDDGYPDGLLTFQWSQVSGPEVSLRSPKRDRTLVHLVERGEYLFRLTASDGDAQHSDEVRVAVVEPKSITLLSPVGGEVWKAGSIQQIKWSAIGVDDVAIHYSIDDGENWFTLSPSVDTSSDDWGDFPWRVPNQPSTRCRVAITSYVNSSDTTRSPEPFEIKGQKINLPTLPLYRPPEPTTGCAVTGARPSTHMWVTLLLLLWRRRKHRVL